MGIDTSVLVRLLVGVLREKGSAKVGFVDRLIRARDESAGRVTLTLDRAQARLGRAEYIG